MPFTHGTGESYVGCEAYPPRAVLGVEMQRGIF